MMSLQGYFDMSFRCPNLRFHIFCFVYYYFDYFFLSIFFKLNKQIKIKKLHHSIKNKKLIILNVNDECTVFPNIFDYLVIFFLFLIIFIFKMTISSGKFLAL